MSNNLTFMKLTYQETTNDPRSFDLAKDFSCFFKRFTIQV